MAQGHKGVNLILWVQAPLEGILFINILISLVLAARQKPGVKFRHLTHYARFPLATLLYGIQHEADFVFVFINYNYI